MTNKIANEQIRYKHAFSHNRAHLSDILCIQPTASKPWEPAISPTRKVVDMRQAQRALDDWFETLHARNDKQLSPKPRSNPPAAKPWRTLKFLRSDDISFRLHQNIVSTFKLCPRQDHAVNASLLGTCGRQTVDCSFSRRSPRDIIVQAWMHGTAG